MALQVCRHPNAAAFIERAEGWLLRAEAEHNLLLGLARQLTRSAEGYDAPVYLATVEDESRVAGCAFRTPPFKLGLTRMPEDAVPLLADDVAEVYAALPAVFGPARQARAFAERWSRRHGVSLQPGMKQRIYQLEHVTRPDSMPPGALRLAAPRDRDRAARWIAAFTAEAGVPGRDAKAYAADRIAQEALFLWEDGGAVSMAGVAGRTPHGARVGYVYTPPAQRGRGYASACVAALSQRLLDAGLTFCFLYTDRSNPTSNSIYPRLGYRPVCDVVECRFEAVSSASESVQRAS